jgi:hypothetical protein
MTRQSGQSRNWLGFSVCFITLTLVMGIGTEGDMSYAEAGSKIEP